MQIQFTKVERVTFAEDRANAARYWVEKTIEERVIAAWNLAEDDLFVGEHHESQAGTAFSVRRVPQSWR
jgi:hypothetical protein